MLSVKVVKAALLIGAAWMLQACGCEVVETGERGIKKHLGAVVGEPLPEGLQFHTPFTESIVTLSVREDKLEGTTSIYTADKQVVTVSYQVSYFPRPEKIGSIYKQFGEDWVKVMKLEAPILSSMKAIFGKYTADDLITARGKIGEEVAAAVRAELATRDVVATRFDITNMDFDDAYEAAVRNKVVAIQNAEGAKNKTVEIEENAKQTLIAAKAEAESMQIRAQALSQNKGLVEYTAVEKWDGKLPQYMMGGQSMPFINLSK